MRNQPSAGRQDRTQTPSPTAITHLYMALSTADLAEAKDFPIKCLAITGMIVTYLIASMTITSTPGLMAQIWRPRASQPWRQCRVRLGCGRNAEYLREVLVSSNSTRIIQPARFVVAHVVRSMVAHQGYPGKYASRRAPLYSGIEDTLNGTGHSTNQPQSDPTITKGASTAALCYQGQILGISTIFAPRSLSCSGGDDRATEQIDAQ